jgi:tripartite-type tricarboxylate transporter receptor subunit TctC
MRKLLVTLALSGAAFAASAAFPDKPITLVIPYPPGGAVDVTGRVIARGLESQLGQPVIVDNKPGAGTVLAAGALARAPADGYTLLLSGNTTFTVNPALRANLPYNPLTSFESIGNVGYSTLVLLANKDYKPNSLAEVISDAKAKPGKLSYASFGSGTTAHLAGEMLKQQAGIDMVHVPYKGSAPAMTDLLGGRVEMSIDTTVAAAPQVAAGKLKAIAVTNVKRSATMPGVPTFAEAGFPGFDMSPWIAVVAPKGLPPPVARTLAEALSRTLASPEVRAQLEKAGITVDPAPPMAYQQRVERELPQLRALIARTGITID